MTFGSLFAGIGGIDLGLERAGMECRWQVENDPYCQRVLAKHWPDAGRWDDVCTFPPNPAEDWHVDGIAFGFPCQDLSYAGRGAGLAGERSGLFFEAVRVVRILRPRWVLIENVAALLTRGLDVVLGELAALGFDAEWHCLQAADFGAPHIRDRVFILAYARFECGDGRGGQCGGSEETGARNWSARPGEHAKHATDPDALCGRREEPSQQDCESQRGCEAGERRGDADGLRDSLAYPIFTRLEGHAGDGVRGDQPGRLGTGTERPVGAPGLLGGADAARWWSVEPAVGELVDGVSGGLVRFNGRTAHKIPDRVNKLRGLGNAVVPQVAEWLGRRIMEANI